MRSSERRSRPGALVLTVLGGLTLLCFPRPSCATDRVWTGGTSTAWGTNSNWTGNAPSSGDNAVFNNTFVNQPNVGNTSAGGIWMTGSLVPNVTISGAGTLTLSGNTINGTAGLGILVDN